MAKCVLCNKKTVVGRNVSHSGRRTRKLFKPNLHKYHGRYYCTKCLRKYKKKEKPQKPTLKETPVLKTA